MRHTSVALAINSFLGNLPPPPNIAAGRWALGDEDPPVRATRRCKVILVFFIAFRLIFSMFQPVLRIRIRINRIHMFLGLLNPDPISFVRGLDPYPRLWILQSVSKNSKKNLNFYFFLTFYLEKLCESSFKK